MPNQCKAFPSHSKIWVYLGLINPAGCTLMTQSLKPCPMIKVYRHPMGDTQTWYTLGLLVNGLRLSNGAKFEPVSIW